MSAISYPAYDAGDTGRRPVPLHYREFGYITSSMADAIHRDLRARGYEVRQRCVSNPSAAPRRYAVWARQSGQDWQRIEFLCDYEGLIEEVARAGTQ